MAQTSPTYTHIYIYTLISSKRFCDNMTFLHVYFWAFSVIEPRFIALPFVLPHCSWQTLVQKFGLRLLVGRPQGDWTLLKGYLN